MSLYHPSIHDATIPAPSWWEETAGSLRGEWPALEGDQTCDVAVIGGGFTGLSAALHLARDHGIDARVLEAGPIAWGASGRNGGFCLIGATKLSIAAMVRQYGLEETQRFYAAQQEGVDLVRELCETEGIECDRCGDGTFAVAHTPRRFDELREEADNLTRLFGITTRLWSRDAFREICHDGTAQYGALHIGNRAAPAHRSGLPRPRTAMARPFTATAAYWTGPGTGRSMSCTRRTAGSVRNG